MLTKQRLDQLKLWVSNADYVMVGNWKDGDLYNIDGDVEQLIDDAIAYLEVMSKHV